MVGDGFPRDRRGDGVVLEREPFEDWRRVRGREANLAHNACGTAARVQHQCRRFHQVQSVYREGFEQNLGHFFPG